MRRLVVILSLALTTCQSIPEGSNCAFWDNIPRDASQQPWREFDCPFVGSKNV